MKNHQNFNKIQKKIKYPKFQVENTSNILRLFSEKHEKFIEKYEKSIEICKKIMKNRKKIMKKRKKSYNIGKILKI